MDMNFQSLIDANRHHESDKPVTLAKYDITIVMNEEDDERDNMEHRKALADEFQRALDDGYFTDLRYDTLRFFVHNREVLDIAPQGKPDAS